MHERLKKIRKISGCTQKEFAEKLGISFRALQNYEAGNRTPPIDIATQLYTRMNVDLVWFLTGKGSMRPAKCVCENSNDLDIPTFIRNGNGRIWVADPEGKPREALNVIKENAENKYDDTDEDDHPQRQLEPEQPRTQKTDTIQAAEILALLSKILADEDPKMIKMVALYLRNVNVLINEKNND